VRARIGEAFRRASAGNRAAFVAYLTAGDPDAETTVELARAAAAGGADVLELGVPFSDPIADGATLQRAAARALAAGTTLDRVFSVAARIRETTTLPLVLFSYANPLLARGPNALREAKDAGFDGVLLTDVPVEEADAFLPAIRKAELDSIFLVSPTSTVPRMREAAALSRGFLYVVSRNGTTGEKAKLAADLGATVRRARRAVSARDVGPVRTRDVGPLRTRDEGSARGLPIAVGFGIATPEDAAAVAAIADGVVVGSALVSCAERGGRHAARDLERLVRSLSGACAR
jgi:tryptophan synthase alpha chain